MLINILFFLAALAVLVIMSDKFVEAAEKIGLSFGISPFIIGVTIVAFGTSLPELAASIAAILNESPSMPIGTVVGSNIANILLVLGLTAIVGKRIDLDFDVMDTDMPLLIASAFFLYFVCADLQVTIFEASLFVIALVIFLVNSIKGNTNEDPNRPAAGIKEYGLLLVAGVGVYFGAAFTAQYLKVISIDMNVSEEVISSTILAIGTSLPEVVVSLAAARRGAHAIAVGNVLGSNIFNTYAVIGIPSFFGTLVIPPGMLRFELLFMIVVTALFGLICLSKRISKWEGYTLVLFYSFFLMQCYTNALK